MQGLCQDSLCSNALGVRLHKQDLVRHLLLEGRRGAARKWVDAGGGSTSAADPGFPLMYQWHGKPYLGAIHGEGQQALQGQAVAAPRPRTWSSP